MASVYCQFLLDNKRVPVQVVTRSHFGPLQQRSHTVIEREKMAATNTP